MIAQEEEIHLDNPMIRENLGIIAAVMGYESDGAASATDFLLTDYYRTMHEAKETVEALLPYVTRHLVSITVFGRLLRHKKATDPGEKRIGNLAQHFVEETRFFKGTRFWDDIITTLQHKEGRLLKRLANDLYDLEVTEQFMIIRDYIEWGYCSFYAMISFIVLLHEYREQLPNPHIHRKFIELFFGRLAGSVEEAERLCTLFEHYPRLMHVFINLLTEAHQRRFYAWLDIDLWDQEMVPARNRLQLLLKLHYSSSKYFERIINNVLNEQPQYLNHFDDDGHLMLIGKGSLAEAERTAGFKQKFKKLKFYFDFEFFRIGLNNFAGHPIHTIAVEFTEFSDTYLKLLFDTCKRELDEQHGRIIQTKDLFGIFITGGQGQMLAFDDDYDLIILLNSDDRTMNDYCDAIIRRMHRELIKCGIMPHYRIADFTHSYLCTFNQLKNILQDDSEDRIIDKSQLLNARMVVGSSVLLHAFEKEIMAPYIYNDKKQFVLAILAEMDSGKKLYNAKNLDSVNIKEGSGGLRDIELLLLMYRIIFLLKEHSNYALLDLLQNTRTGMAKELKALSDAYAFLRQVRNINRLKIAATNTLEKDYIQNLVEFFDIKPDKKMEAAEVLLEQVRVTMRCADRTIHRVIHKDILPHIRK